MSHTESSGHGNVNEKHTAIMFIYIILLFQLKNSYILRNWKVCLQGNYGTFRCRNTAAGGVFSV